MQGTRTDHGLGAIRGTQFRQEMLDMEFDGVQAEHQVLGDLLVGEALGHQLQDVPLPCTQRLVERRVWCWLCRGIGLGLPDGHDRIADAEDTTLRLSMDAKALVKVGPFARGGKNRVLTKATDHDFEAQATVTPVGIILPTLDEFFLYGVRSKVTSDCLVDRLTQWWESVKKRFDLMKTLVINLDNGPENHRHRTQFMQRLLEFAQNYQITIRLAYYPPYHSKYTTVERCWGILEQHWNGALLDSVDAVIHFAQTMTWKGKHPMVELVTSPIRLECS